MTYARTGTAVMNEMRLKVFSHLQELSMDFYSRSQIGDLMSRFSTDLASVENALIWYLPAVIVSSVGLIASVLLLMGLNWRLAIFCIVGLAISFKGANLLQKEASAQTVRMKEKMGSVSVVLQENLSAQAVVKGFNLKPYALNLFRARLNALRDTAIRANWSNYLMERIPCIGALLTGIAVLCIGAFLVFRKEMSVGDLVAFYSLYQQVSDAVSSLTYSIPSLMEGAAGMERLNEILAEVPTIKDLGTKEAPVEPEKGIRLDNVTFQYSADNKSLDGVSLVIDKGMSVAFVGPSGSGKSTILNMVTRFWEPGAGVVSYDGIDLREISLESLHDRMGIVFQENVLFDMSIRENIRMGRLSATDQEVEDAAKRAEIHDFIMSLPDRYDARVGERGGRLSGGQRQRIAIARAIVRRPSVIILDEATSALDPQTEVAVNETIRAVGRGRGKVLLPGTLDQRCVGIHALGADPAIQEGGRSAVRQPVELDPESALRALNIERGAGGILERDDHAVGKDLPAEGARPGTDLGGRLGHGLLGGHLAHAVAPGLPRVATGHLVARAEADSFDRQDLTLVDRDPAAPVLGRLIAHTQEQPHGNHLGIQHRRRRLPG
jgi:ATP-binding cassette subfamily B protein